MQPLAPQPAGVAERLDAEPGNGLQALGLGRIDAELQALAPRRHGALPNIQSHSANCERK